MKEWDEWTRWPRDDYDGCSLRQSEGLGFNCGYLVRAAHDDGFLVVTVVEATGCCTKKLEIGAILNQNKK